MAKATINKLPLTQPRRAILPSRHELTAPSACVVRPHLRPEPQTFARPALGCDGVAGQSAREGGVDGDAEAVARQRAARMPSDHEGGLILAHASPRSRPWSLQAGRKFEGWSIRNSLGFDLVELGVTGAMLHGGADAHGLEPVARTQGVLRSHSGGPQARGGGACAEARARATMSEFHIQNGTAESYPWASSSVVEEADHREPNPVHVRLRRCGEIICMCQFHTKREFSF